jgi:hypothetical protein
VSAQYVDGEEEDGWFEARGSNAWLLPLLRQHLCGARLAYFASDLLPLAKQMAEYSQQAAAAGNPLVAQRAATAEFQVWIFPSVSPDWSTASSYSPVRLLIGPLPQHIP